MELRWEEVHPGLEHGGRLVDLDVAGVGGSRGAGGLAGGVKAAADLKWQQFSTKSIINSL